jgi:hypothetical protein
MIDFHIEYDDGMDAKRDPNPPAVRKGRPTGYYIVTSGGDIPISIGYLRISEMPVIDKLIRRMVVSNNRRFERKSDVKARD